MYSYVCIHIHDCQAKDFRMFLCCIYIYIQINILSSFMKCIKLTKNVSKDICAYRYVCMYRGLRLGAVL